MDFEEALAEELYTIECLRDKVFPLNAKEGTKAPYVIFLSSIGLQDKSFEGYLDSKVIPCEINILHKSYRELKPLTKQVLNKILSFQDRKIGSEGPVIKNVTYEEPVELYEQQVNLFRSVFDIKVRI
ncbi:DUF3168 domain-containing protein [Neobacillus mesonae]|uniref:DUF3168 domain-containing protein n=1 Tax=Neobacillus mesonae TaxID=1193713 RepID=UPI002E1D95C5|nr:DUF3168 domain-containing protein [Neobacillus mesonae]